MESYQVFNGLFKLFSSTSVNNPFEVIIILISICISLSILSSSSSSHFNPSPTATANSPLRFVEITINSNPIDNPMSYFNYSFLMFLRCLAFIFLVFQFKSLKKVHSKFILALTVSTTLISSIIFNNALIKWFDFEIPNNLLLIIDMLIYTLVLIDPKKCNQLLNRSLDTKCVKEAKSELAQYFAQHAANSCLDTLSLVLLFSLGNLSDSREIRNFAQFSCLLIISNFFIFFTIYPALLSLVLQFKSKGKNEESSIEKKRVDDNRTAGLVLSSLTNPIVVYIKVLMTLFLVLIHLKLKFFNAKNLNSHENVKNRTKEASLSNIEQLSASELQEETIFYAECCLLITLLIYICTKFAKLEEINETNAYLSLSQTPSTNDGSTQTEPEINKIPTIKIEESVLPPKESQTHESRSARNESETIRPMLECINIMKSTPGQRLDELTDAEVIELVKCKQVPIYKLESHFSDAVRAIELRRRIVSGKMPSGVAECFEKLPYEAYDYAKVAGSCCENVIGYVPVPLGVAGPLKIDGLLYHIPMATTEGTLVASTNRGCTALSSGQGVFTRVLSDGMSRGPVLEFSSAMRAAEVKEWLDWEENFIEIKRAFDTTSRFAKLESTKCCVVGKYLYIRFVARTGDAMGMNMLSKGSEKALAELQKHFPDAQIKSVSGNYCSDKKATAINWIEGRGKSVVCEATIKGDVVRNVLKTSVKALVDLNLTKNLVGSAMAGSIGGFNAHAANIVAALFIACGQDPAQVVESSNCLTWMECVGPNNEDLYVSCTMPSLEVGTVGGGTFLDAQSSCLKILGVFGPNEQNPGENACKLARIIASAVLAGELSLMSALASGHLVNSHMKYNRSTISMKSLDGPTNNNNNNNNAHNLL